MMNKALVTVYGAITPHTAPARFAAVAPLSDKGETLVTLVLPYGVRVFPRIPCSILVPLDDTYVDFPRGEKPVLTVNFWEPFYDNVLI